MEDSVSLDESATLKALSMEDIVAKHRKEKKELQGIVSWQKILFFGCLFSFETKISNYI